jgi:4'-phosphopantetheinyl transferase
VRLFTHTDYIKCCFTSEFKSKSEASKGRLNIFYAKTEELSSRLSDLENYISGYEKLRAEKFYFKTDRDTYLTSHAILRLVLADYLNTNPINIKYINGKNNKPGLEGDPIYFNISHAKEAFAIAVSKDFYVGIDLEYIDENLEIHPIAKSFFGEKEREYIFRSKIEARDRFFLLWTRKEALLKALGIGLINNLKEVELCDQENHLNKKSFNLPLNSISDLHYIYSKRWLNYYLSIAIPEKVTLGFIRLTSENYTSF